MTKSFTFVLLSSALVWFGMLGIFAPKAQDFTLLQRGILCRHNPFLSGLYVTEQSYRIIPLSQNESIKKVWHVAPKFFLKNCIPLADVHISPNPNPFDFWTSESEYIKENWNPNTFFSKSMNPIISRHKNPWIQLF